ncbi:hypothetical protein [Ruficoccus sp. ZRK36]|uniref:hypothetical protein n=1 Tax=Ruficoccus sp. ZRK36 TaxID=2866311 RepID=UPI001C735C4F|nr:hypothetical protein [Ruficoccus sp. ZRK36]QYY35284.1 hypothetical protein K0V07_13405 [Ruficoccus sp. ZRK36]
MQLTALTLNTIKTRLGLTVQELADMAAVSVPTINGALRPSCSVKTACRIAGALDSAGHAAEAKELFRALIDDLAEEYELPPHVITPFIPGPTEASLSAGEHKLIEAIRGAGEDADTLIDAFLTILWADAPDKDRPIRFEPPEEPPSPEAFHEPTAAEGKSFDHAFRAKSFNLTEAEKQTWEAFLKQFPSPRPITTTELDALLIEHPTARRDVLLERLTRAGYSLTIET